ncbi:alpha/beta hydrolase [uncultured Microbacterium sp.]|uniref:alpha/beta fold hydrolase n=1 Tax=uncultured Microbacterium sp. TaxID=191216 RepID=UPI00263832E6|nr:alpha/beta hydrolase [uncultured Microbacterium sp.]
MIALTRGEGIPLIAIHGFGVDHRIMLPLEDMVPDAGWQRVYIDLPWAEGTSDTGARTPRELAHQVMEEVRDLAAGGPFAIIGNSFGAMVARHIAHALPEQSLGLATLAGVFEMDHALRTLPEHEVVVADEAVLQAAGADRDAFTEMAVVQTPATLEAFRRFVVPGAAGADLRVLERLSRTYAEASAPENDATGPFTAPALHIFGRQDQVVGFEDGLAHRAHYLRGTFVVLDGAGHNLHLEHPGAVGALVRDWLSRARADARIRGL